MLFAPDLVQRGGVRLKIGMTDLPVKIHRLLQLYDSPIELAPSGFLLDGRGLFVVGEGLLLVN